MESIFEQLVVLLDRGEKAALSTVISRSGSIPAPANSKLLVSGDGTSWGTIGGGSLEAEVCQVSRKALREERPVVSSFDFGSEELSRDGLLCGGKARVFTDLVFPDLSSKKIFKAALGRMRSRNQSALATAVFSSRPEKPPQGSRMLFDRGGILAGSLPEPEWNDKVREMSAPLLGQEDPLFLELENRLKKYPHLEGFLVEFLQTAPSLVIFGGGHLAVPLCRIGSMCGFRVTVVDDRPEFANRERFPEASEIMACDFSKAFEKLEIGPRHYLVSVTRGHLEDRTVIKAAVRCPAAYIGMIGSKRKVKILWESLQKEGIKPELLERVHAPIGLDIRAETPEEIAVSIMAQIVLTRRSRKPDIKHEILSL